MRSGYLEVVGTIRSRVGESPFWDADRMEIVWVDIPAGKVHRHHLLHGARPSLDLGRPVGSIAPREGGGLVIAVQDGFGVVETDGSVRMVQSVEADDDRTRMNDGACDSRGRFWAGTMAYDMSSPCGGLYRLDPDYAVTSILTGVTVSNGLCWSRADDEMYFIDTVTQQVDVLAYDPDSGTVDGRRRLIPIDPDTGMPDGIAIDIEGCLWVAMWGGGTVHRYSATGQLDSVLDLPTPQITSCAFGGPGLEHLFVTSAWDGFSEAARADDPLAGALFLVDVGVAGLDTNRFQG